MPEGIVSGASRACRRASARRGLPAAWAAVALALGCSPPPESTLGEPIAFGPFDAIAADSWPQYRLDPAHQGVAPPGTMVDRGLTLVWKTPEWGIGDYSASKSSPTVDAERIYLGFDDGSLRAFDRATGALRWSFATRRRAIELQSTDSNHRGIHGTAAVDDCCVYIGDYDGWLYAVDKTDGTPRWEQRLGGSIGASPVLYRGNLFVAVEFGDPDARVVVVAAADGHVVYRSPRLGEQAHGSVTIDPRRGYMLVGANNGQLSCFDFVNRRLVWRYRTLAAIKSTAAIAGDAVYFSSWDYQLHALDIDSGLRRFVFRTHGLAMSSPSIYRGRVYFGSHDGSIYDVDAGDGQLSWSVQTGGIVQSSPTVIADSGVLAVGSRDRQLYLLDLEDGTLRDSVDLGRAITSVPVAVGRSLFVSDDTGALWRWDRP